MVNLKYFVGHEIKIQIMNTNKNSAFYAVLSEKKLQMCLVGRGGGVALTIQQLEMLEGVAGERKNFTHRHII